jgi:acyl-CoA thioester hydrolase
MLSTVFRHTHRVTYADCTLGNHIYYARYLDLIEAARSEFFRWLGHPLLILQAQEMLFPVIEARLHYRAPARYDDVLEIEYGPVAVERVRVNFAARITRPADGKVILEAETFHVCTSLAEKPRRLPEALAAQLKALCPVVAAPTT